MIDFLRLQNGSDIRGVAIEGIPGEDVNITPEVAGAIGASFAYWLGFKIGKNPFDLRICVGHDSRLSACELKEGLLKGITMFGAEGYDAGLASTPAMFMSTILPQFDYDGAIMITASHLPYNRNGFKFFTKEGGLDKSDIKQILKTASRYNFVGDYYEERKTPLMPMYAAYLRQMIAQGLADIPGYLAGMHIVVDAGNGAGGFYATEVLQQMGADISGSCFLEPDGSFPNHEPNPENKEAMDAICRAVVDNKADLGIIFDTDVDRISAVGPDGRPIARNEIVALAAALAAEDYPGGSVVTDSITSNELHDFIEKKLGLNHIRFKRGYRNVIGRALEDGNAFLAIETSGHAAYRDNFFLDDGAFLATQIVINAAKLKSWGKTISSLIEGLESPAEAREVRFTIEAEDYASVGERVLDAMHEWAKNEPDFEIVSPNYEGIRVNFGSSKKNDGTHIGATSTSDCPDCTGWFLLRKSLHDPVLALNIEASCEGGIDPILDRIKEFLGQFPNIR